MAVAPHVGSTAASYVNPGLPTPPSCVQSLAISLPCASRSLRARTRTQ